MLFNNQRSSDEQISFSRKTETALDEIVQSSFLEYLSDDLESVQQADKNIGGLLGQDEKRGFERLIEALQCSMWSNMVQVKQTQITPLMVALAKPAQELPSSKATETSSYQ